MDKLSGSKTGQISNEDSQFAASKSMMQSFVAGLNKYEGLEYLLYTVAFNAAPTIEGTKPSTLMSFTKNSKNLYLLWEMYKTQVCTALNLEYYELKKTNGSIVVLFYIRKFLRKCLNGRKCREFL